MPFYEYHCPANGRTVEVRHAMSQHMKTWGEVSAAAGISDGDTALDAPVERLMSMASVGTGSTSTSAAPAGGFQGCGAGCGCAHQA